MRAIDADAMRQNWLENGQNEYVYDTNAVLDSIDAQPTIEAEPVRHGRWIERPNTKGQVYCSECGTLEKITDNNFKSRRCPNCGAKMDLVEERHEPDEH